MAIDKVAQGLQLICSKTKTSMCLVHHTSKSGGKNAGDQNASRGASSLVAAVRIAHTLMDIQPEEAKRLKIADEKVKWFVRLNDAKANMSPPNAGIRYFERVSVELPSGDNVGVVTPYTKVTEPIAQVFENSNLINAVFEAWRKPVTVNKLAGILHRDHKALGSKSTIYRALLKNFEKGQEYDGRRLIIGPVSDGSVDADGLIEDESDNGWDF
jgi:hypothetical protein